MGIFKKKEQGIELREMTADERLADAKALMVDIMEITNFYYVENEFTGMDKYSGFPPEYAESVGESSDCHLDESFTLPHPDREDCKDIPFTEGKMFADKMESEFFQASVATDRKYDDDYVIVDADNGREYGRTENLLLMIMEEKIKMSDILDASEQSHPQEFEHKHKIDRDMTD